MFGPIRAFAVGSALFAADLAVQPLQAAIAGAAGPLHCELRTSSAGAGVTLSAVAISSVAATGNYRLVLSKSGNAGGSDIEQSGAFSLPSGGERTLGVISMSLESGAIYEATLTVTWKGGVVSCARIFPSWI